MIIPGQIITLLTFPGVIVHEIAHQLFCRLLGVAVFDVCYFQLGNPAGYVVHEPPRAFRHSLLISTGPFLLNTLLGAMIAFPVIPLLHFQSATPIDGFLIWLGISIAMHAFPSTGDAAALWNAANHFHGGGFAKALAAPVVGFIYLGAFGSLFWLDLFFGITVCCAPPLMIVYAFA